MQNDWGLLGQFPPGESFFTFLRGANKHKNTPVFLVFSACENKKGLRNGCFTVTEH